VARSEGRVGEQSRTWMRQHQKGKLRGSTKSLGGVIQLWRSDAWRGVRGTDAGAGVVVGDGRAAGVGYTRGSPCLQGGE